jgi:L-asparagine transporter-like permease
LLHENLGQAHRKHVYQLMANELKMPHVVVSTIYMVIQLVISLIAIYLIPDTTAAHWIYFGVMSLVLGLGYIVFKMKYYHLHEEYLAGLESRN